MLLPNASTPNPALLIIECGCAALALAAAYAWPMAGAGLFARVEKHLAALARKKALAVVSIGLAVIVLRLAILPLHPQPLPFVPDDFSFLLAADTFAHGRLTNPTPAMWTHFESIHITMQPTYQSMYFPGQGLLLAAGQVLFHDPWVALLLMSALMCAALCWCLQAWLPPGWALLGGAIAVLRLGVFSYWTNTYHAGGSLAALGGALILGSLPRLKKTARLRYAFLMGAGAAILVLSRPYEGFLLCLPVGCVLAHWMWKSRERFRPAVMIRLAAVPVLFGLAAVAWLGYYDWKAFGKATTLPYTVDRNTYAIAPYYIWQQPRPTPIYRHRELRVFYERDEMGQYYALHSLRGLLPQTMEKLGFAFLFYAGFSLFLPLLMIRRVFFDRRIRFLIVCSLVLAGGMVIEIFLLPHYIAPFTAAFYAIGLQMMRHLRVWKPENKPVGIALTRLTVVVCVVMAGLRVFAAPLLITPHNWPSSNWNFNWFGPERYGTERARIQTALECMPGRELVLVHYAPDHYLLDEWVYNSADIDSSKVVWAREMDTSHNLELMHYYKDRQVWLVEPDAIPARISPYPFEESKR